MKKKWRFINSGFSDPYTNMAIDEALFIKYEETKQPTLRIYGWEPPGFSIGYFQKIKSVLDIEKCKNDNILFVRRITGGETIFHHIEVTYSITCDAKDLDIPSNFIEGYKKVCEFIFNAYKMLGFSPKFKKDTDIPKLPKGNLCFASYEEYDIIINGKKLGGNAQKRKKNIIFQHGSIPLQLKYNVFKEYLINKEENIEKKVTSLEEVLNREIDFIEFSNILKNSFENTYDIKLIEEKLSSKEQELSQKLTKEKYLTDEWNFKR